MLRYLDPKTSRWLSSDPAMGEYIAGASKSGGIYNPINMHVYHYSFSNPVRYTDPDGREGEQPQPGAPFGANRSIRYMNNTSPAAPAAPPASTPATPPPAAPANAAPNPGPAAAPNPAPATPSPIIQNNGPDLAGRVLMGTNGISGDGPCLAMSYMGVAQTYAGRNLTPQQVRALLNDSSIWNGNTTGGAAYVIGETLRALGVDTSNLTITRRDGAADPAAFATVRHVGRADTGVAGHWQEGTNTGGFMWDPLDGDVDNGRRVFETRNIYITPRRVDE